ncbi:hypothetical protein Q8A67_011129 [Cirrhinus molitorella]|uniref:Tetraspanin n=1 Tax=Cirrhinus molitorella TaxID=172907 RepID=A0AA88PX30_9TELE|nr:hypothetical protein Q8A67_011129 [Cirrhinus molitorella]
MQNSPHASHRDGSESGAVTGPLCTPPPAYPNHIKEEMERDGLYGCDTPSSKSIGDDSGYCTPSYGHHQARAMNAHYSPPLLSPEHQMPPNWAARYDRRSPMSSMWSPYHLDAYGCNPSAIRGFFYSPSEKHNSLQPLTPVTPDSGCWEGGLEGTPPASSSFCVDNPEVQRMESQQESGIHHGPLPELPALSLQEILGELQGDWWQGEGRNSHSSEDNHALCDINKEKKMHYYRYENAEVSCCYKYLMFSYNIIFWLAGTAFIAIGFWAWSEKGVLSDLTQVTRLHGFDPVWGVLVVGTVTFILGFAGCVGALRENICLLKFFSGVIGFIFFLELTAAVLAFVFQGQVREWINEFFLANVKAYREDIDLQNLIDSLQKLNHCCGAKDPNDWDLNVYFNCSTGNPSRERCGVPFSCCISDPADTVVNTQCGYDIRKTITQQWGSTIYVKGCMMALEEWLPRNLYIVAGVFIVISLLQMVGIFLARTLIGDIEKVKFNYY